jgi:hypothetical protein
MKAPTNPRDGAQEGLTQAETLMPVEHCPRLADRIRRRAEEIGTTFSIREQGTDAFVLIESHVRDDGEPVSVPFLLSGGFTLGASRLRIAWTIDGAPLAESIKQMHGATYGVLRASVPEWTAVAPLLPNVDAVLALRLRQLGDHNVVIREQFGLLVGGRFKHIDRPKYASSLSALRLDRCPGVPGVAKRQA